MPGGRSAILLNLHPVVANPRIRDHGSLKVLTPANAREQGHASIGFAPASGAIRAGRIFLPESDPDAVSHARTAPVHVAFYTSIAPPTVNSSSAGPPGCHLCSLLTR